MNWSDLGSGVALVLIFEGVLLFISPSRWRLVVAQMLTLSYGKIRNYGFWMLVLGSLLLYLVKV